MKHEQTGYWRRCSSVGLVLAARRSAREILAAPAALSVGRLATTTMLLLCLWGSVQVTPPTQPLLTDDFNDGNDNGWTQLNRSWHVIDGRYHLDGCYGCNGVPLTGALDGFSYTHVDDPTWTDYTFEFTFDTTNAPSADNPDPGGTVHQAMVFFRVQGPLPAVGGATTQYRAQFGAEPGFGRAIALEKYVNGDPTGLVLKLISDFPLLDPLIGTYTGKIIVSGGHIQIFVNNQLVIDFTDPDPIPFGGIGLGAIWSVNAWFDNVSVTPGISFTEDSDGDGVQDEEDECPDSDRSATVIIDDCQAGVLNPLFPSGCTLSDLLTTCAEGARNHGKFVSCVAHLTTKLEKVSIITSRQKGAIQSCAAQASIP